MNDLISQIYSCVNKNICSCSIYMNNYPIDIYNWICSACDDISIESSLQLDIGNIATMFVLKANSNINKHTVLLTDNVPVLVSIIPYNMDDLFVYQTIEVTKSLYDNIFNFILSKPGYNNPDISIILKYARNILPMLTLLPLSNNIVYDDNIEYTDVQQFYKIINGEYPEIDSKTLEEICTTDVSLLFDKYYLIDILRKHGYYEQDI